MHSCELNSLKVILDGGYEIVLDITNLSLKFLPEFLDSWLDLDLNQTMLTKFL